MADGADFGYVLMTPKNFATVRRAAAPTGIPFITYQTESDGICLLPCDRWSMA